MKKTISLFFSFQLTLFTLSAQTISLEQARRIVVETYPSLKAARLRVSSQKALKATAFDIGQTEISTGIDQTGKDPADATQTLVGFHQNLDVLGIPARHRLQKSMVDVAQAASSLADENMEYNVSIDYSKALVAHERLLVYQELDTIYHNFQKVAHLRYETGEDNRLEFIYAKQQVAQAALLCSQARNDEKLALQTFNLWLGDSTSYMVEQIAESDTVTSGSQAEIRLARALVVQSKNQIGAQRSEFLPKFFAEYNIEKVGGRRGYYEWNIGFSIPLVFGAQAGRVKAARLEHQATQADLSAAESEHAAKRLRNLSEYTKWKKSVDYYRTKVLPLLDEQRHTAMKQYSAGATGYVEFVQHVRQMVETKLQYIDCYENYLISRFNLEFNK